MKLRNSEESNRIVKTENDFSSDILLSYLVLVEYIPRNKGKRKKTTNIWSDRPLEYLANQLVVSRQRRCCCLAFCVTSALSKALVYAHLKALSATRGELEKLCREGLRYLTFSLTKIV